MSTVPEPTSTEVETSQGAMETLTSTTKLSFASSPWAKFQQSTTMYSSAIEKEVGKEDYSPNSSLEEHTSSPIAIDLFKTIVHTKKSRILVSTREGKSLVPIVPVATIEVVSESDYDDKFENDLEKSEDHSLLEMDPFSSPLFCRLKGHTQREREMAVFRVLLVG